MKKTLKARFLMYGNLALAIILGIYAQDIAYYLYYNFSMPLLIGLNLATIISIFLFVLSPLIIKKFNLQDNMQDNMNKKEYKIYFSINIILGLGVSGFSILVWLLDGVSFIYKDLNKEDL